jgi:microcystin-dependent protein
MSSPFVAEIRMFACNFAPKGWATCDGQLLSISQNTALFSLLGTFYGGNGQSTFGLPNLAGRAPMHQGQGPGLSQRFLGETSGSAAVTLLTNEMPLHNHTLNGHNAHIGSLPTPTNKTILAKSAGGNSYTADTSSLTQMNFQALSLAGGSLPHNNMQPYLAVLFCIAMQGMYPARN